MKAELEVRQESQEKAMGSWERLKALAKGVVVMIGAFAGWFGVRQVAAAFLGSDSLFRLPWVQ